MNKSQISLLIERFKQSRDGAKYVLDEVQKGVDSSSELYCLGCIDAYNDVISVLNRLYQQEEENDSN